MKIKKLTIHNIASIADAVIDFGGDLLGKSDLFLIYGDTGAGKSVILDCICLVLFNDAPRLRTEMEGKTDAESFNGGLTLKDTRQMLRRGAGEGFAELVFTGNDGIEYKVSGVRAVPETDLTVNFRLSDDWLNGRVASQRSRR